MAQAASAFGCFQAAEADFVDAPAEAAGFESDEEDDEADDEADEVELVAGVVAGLESGEDAEDASPEGFADSPEVEEDAPADDLAAARESVR